MFNEQMRAIMHGNESQFLKMFLSYLLIEIKPCFFSASRGRMSAGPPSSCQTEGISDVYQVKSQQELGRGKKRHVEFGAYFHSGLYGILISADTEQPAPNHSYPCFPQDYAVKQLNDQSWSFGVRKTCFLVLDLTLQ